jgi:hypothetical protein
MTIPPASDVIWKDLLFKRRQFDFEYLGLKMLLGRLIVDVEHDPSDANVAKCAAQLFDLLVKNQQLPTAANDIQKLGS